MAAVFVYTLSDPRTQQIRYVGISKQPETRLRQHIACTDRRHSHTSRWIKTLKEAGVRPKMDVIEETNEAEWPQREKYWIAHYKEVGCRLTNHAAGGLGYLNPSEEVRKKIGEAAKQRIQELGSQKLAERMAAMRARRLPTRKLPRRRRRPDIAHPLTHEQLSERTKRGHANRKQRTVNMTVEQKLERTRKSWETRRQRGTDTMKTCKRGHPLSGDNIVQTKRQRHCRTCRNQRQQERRANFPDGDPFGDDSAQDDKQIYHQADMRAEDERWNGCYED
jgi:hypothetical protein